MLTTILVDRLRYSCGRRSRARLDRADRGGRDRRGRHAQPKRRREAHGHRLPAARSRICRASSGIAARRASCAATAAPRRSCSSTGHQDEESCRARSRPAITDFIPKRRSVAAPARRCGSGSRSASARRGRVRATRWSRDRSGARARRSPRGRLARSARPAARDQPRDRGAARRDRRPAQRYLGAIERAIGARRAADHRPARGQRDRERRARTHACAGRRRLDRAPGRRRLRAARERERRRDRARTSPTIRSSCRPTAIACSRCSAT